jgi:phosphoribosylglycinamide formyltransferase-1
MNASHGATRGEINPLPIVILISGRGSNLQAIVDKTAAGELPVDIRAVISNRPNAAGLQQARQAGLETRVIDHTGYADRQAFDQALQACIDSYQPGLVVLAGFMRILTPGFVDHYRGRMLNIHPSLLPDLPGLNTHQRALDAGHSEHGASVHFVTEDTDGGPVLLQARVAIHEDDSAESLAARVLEQEHRLYPQAIRWFAEGRIFLDENGRIQLDGALLEQPKTLSADTGTPC